MMLEILSEVSNEFIQNPSIRSFLNLFSVETWGKIQFTRRRDGLKIYETTITQDLLYRFRILAEQQTIPVLMYEAKSEKTNGNDIEIIIETKSGFIMLPCQAKIIYKGDKYKAIDHEIAGRQQIESLLSYAKRKKGLPIYLFYNYCSNFEEVDSISNKIDFYVESYGCSIVKANLLKENFFKATKWTVPKFSSLHPDLAIPFHQLFDTDFYKDDVRTLIDKLQKDIDGDVSNKLLSSIKLYSRQELLDDDDWIDMNPPAGLGKIPLEEESNSLFYNQFNNNIIDGEFNPKFRLVFSGTKAKKGVKLMILS